MSWREKLWGRAAERFRSGTVLFEEINIEAGGFSSYHTHLARHNLFIVDSGRLIISQDNNKPSILGPGEALIVAPGIGHRFEAIEQTVAYEVYWGDNLVGDDIVRSDCGGIRGPGC